MNVASIDERNAKVQGNSFPTLDGPTRYGHFIAELWAMTGDPSVHKVDTHALQETRNADTHRMNNRRRRSRSHLRLNRMKFDDLGQRLVRWLVALVQGQWA